MGVHGGRIVVQTGRSDEPERAGEGPKVLPEGPEEASKRGGPATKLTIRSILLFAAVVVVVGLAGGGAAAAVTSSGSAGASAEATTNTSGIPEEQNPTSAPVTLAPSQVSTKAPTIVIATPVPTTTERPTPLPSTQPTPLPSTQPTHAPSTKQPTHAPPPASGPLKLKLELDGVASFTRGSSACWGIPGVSLLAGEWYAVPDLGNFACSSYKEEMDTTELYQGLILGIYYKELFSEKFVGNVKLIGSGTESGRAPFANPNWSFSCRVLDPGAENGYNLDCARTAEGYKITASKNGWGR